MALSWVALVRTPRSAIRWDNILAEARWVARDADEKTAAAHVADKAGGPWS
jgi:hypothetical protein